MSAGRADVLVVGAGAVGCAVAWALAREGVDVAVLERDNVAAGASGAAAGMVTPLGEARGESPALALGLASLALHRDRCGELRERTGIDPEWVASGVLRVAHDDAEVAELQAKRARLAAHPLEWLDAAAARAALPQLAPAVYGALWSPTEGHLRSPLLTAATARAAVQHGARIETGVEVVSLRRTGERVDGVVTAGGDWSAPHVVLCAGAWSPGIESLADAGLVFPVAPVRGQIVLLDAPEPGFQPIVWDRAGYLVPKRDGSVVVGATEEDAGFDCRVTAAGIAALLAGARAVMPALGAAGFRSAWAGLRPGTPDRLPLVGPVRGRPGLILATGHSRSGVALSAITGELVAATVLGKALPPEATAFRPERFSPAPD